ncbi:hypothetical protein [Corynebacterium sp. AOP12-C2-36]|uniref:hypothetical protein n=1 Tax=Corynebacterium sp. AOP12-C2-36 TaxID=3457723 RepID=UPI004034C9F4
MTIKKSLFAAATATTLVLAGTGLASAQDTDGSLPTAGSLSANNTNEDGETTGSAIVESVSGSALFEPSEECKEVDGKEVCTDGPSTIESSTELLGIVNDFGGAVAGSITLIPDIYDAIQTFQEMVDGFELPAVPNLPF